MDARFAELPSALKERTLITRVAGDVPVLLAHPESGWFAADAEPEPVPTVIWLHGRTAYKELDPGRYLRWVRAGIGACAIDLPGHGERAAPGYDASDHTLRVASQAIEEIDAVSAALGEHPKFKGAFDAGRLGLGGMSLGGMATLARLTRPHAFRCAAVESTAGDFSALAGTAFEQHPWFEALDPLRHLDGFEPLPLLVLHSEADRTVPFAAMSGFIEALRERYSALGADAGQIELTTWAETGAPYEHAGFGRHANEAKNIQTDFLARHLLGPR